MGTAARSRVDGPRRRHERGWRSACLVAAIAAATGGLPGTGALAASVPEPGTAAADRLATVRELVDARGDDRSLAHGDARVPELAPSSGAVGLALGYAEYGDPAGDAASSRGDITRSTAAFNSGVVAVTEAQADGFVTVFPCGAPMPLASNLSYTVGSTIANAVVAKVGAGGSVCLYAMAGTHVVVDANGYVGGTT